MLSDSEAQIRQRLILLLLAEMGIDCAGHVNVRVAQQLLRGVLVHVGLKEQRGEAMTEDMGSQVTKDTEAVFALAKSGKTPYRR